MTEKLKQTIQKELMELPKEWQDAISAVDWIKLTEEIGKRFSLNETEINDFQLETLLVLIGVTDPEFFTINVENQVDITKDKAVSLANEAVLKIFTPLNNIFIENIKKSDKHKNATADQNLDFILSGGDYSAFMTPAREDLPPPLNKGRTEEGSLVPPPPSGEVGRGFSNSPHPNPLLKREGDKSKKMDDLRSKFTI
mgnify:CR=1 FL=1